MAALPYMQFYVADYLADTMHLTTEEHGAYMLLIMNYWQRGKPLDNSNDRLASVARLSNDRWISVQRTLEEFFEIDGDLWIHHRIESELDHVRKQQKQRSQAGKASAKARKTKASERPINERSTVDKSSLNENSTKPLSDTETDKSKERGAGALSRSYSKTPPENFSPEKPMPGQVRSLEGVDIETELMNFKLHTFPTAKPDSAWQGEWLKWLNRAASRPLAQKPNSGIEAPPRTKDNVWTSP